MTAARHIMLLSVAALCIACDNPVRPTTPSQPPASSISTSSPPQSPFVVPPLTGPSTSYLYSGQLDHPVNHYTLTSKFVLYENGAFSLQYLSLGGQYTGAYQRDNSRITFRFAGGGDASGTITSDVLEVRFSLNMQMSDFDNAVYTRAP